MRDSIIRLRLNKKACFSEDPVRIDNLSMMLHYQITIITFLTLHLLKALQPYKLWFTLKTFLFGLSTFLPPI